MGKKIQHVKRGNKSAKPTFDNSNLASINLLNTKVHLESEEKIKLSIAI